MAHNLCCDSYHVHNMTYLLNYCNYIRVKCVTCYFLGPLFTDWASGCYVHFGCIGSPEPSSARARNNSVVGSHSPPQEGKDTQGQKPTHYCTKKPATILPKTVIQLYTLTHATILRLLQQNIKDPIS